MNSLFGYQLGLFGEIDAEVVRARTQRSTADLEIIDTVERLLPNTTGFGQAGWYAELQQFLNRSTRRPPPDQRTRAAAPESLQLPTFQQSINTLQELTRGRVARSAAAEPAEDVVVRNAVATGAAYPAMVLAKIDAIRSRSEGVSNLTEPLSILSDLPAVDPAVRSRRAGDDFRIDIPIPGAQFASIRSALHRIDDRDDFVHVLKSDLDDDVADKCQTCFGMLEEVDGQYCSTIYTDTPEPDVTVADVRRILDPRNWPECCDFFRTVALQDPHCTTQGWSRVLETISPEPEDYLLDTALLFFYGETDDGGLYLNYDIDPSKQSDCGLVEVDSGYIWVTPLDPTQPDRRGVRLRTSKQERVNGLSPTATSALACHLGWGQISRNMLAGKAWQLARQLESGEVTEDDVKQKYFLFEASPPTIRPDKDVKPPAPGPEKSYLPPNFGDTVADTAALANLAIEKAATIWGRATQRWLDGLTRKDVTAIVSEIGAGAVEVAEAIYDTAADNVRPEFLQPKDKGADVHG